MKHAVIFAHPRDQSFTGSVATAYADAARALGHTVILRDLYRMNFDPCLKAGEIPSPSGFRPEADAAAERALLQDIDVFALVYPLWLNAPPAMLKGYLERVFGFGFAYGAASQSGNPLLTGRKLISFSSSGAPLAWVQQTGAFDALCNLFDSYFSELCGMTSLDHLHFGQVEPGASKDFVRARLDDVRNAVRKHFESPA